MNVTPFGAKSPTSTVVGVAANANGNLLTSKKWENEIVEIYSKLPDKTRTTTTRYDIGDAAAVSLRFTNTTNNSFTIYFYADQVTSSDFLLYDINGNPVSYKIVKSVTRTQILTPEDAPILQWLKNIKLRVDFDEVPKSGNLKIEVVIKR